MASMDRQQEQQKLSGSVGGQSSAGAKGSVVGEGSVGGKDSVVGGRVGGGKQQRRSVTSISKETRILGVPEKARALVGD